MDETMTSTESSAVTTGDRTADNAARYEVVHVRTGGRIGNHTYAEAVARANIMRRNWLYREHFVVEPRQMRART